MLSVLFSVSFAEDDGLVRKQIGLVSRAGTVTYPTTEYEVTNGCSNSHRTVYENMRKQNYIALGLSGNVQSYEPESYIFDLGMKFLVGHYYAKDDQPAKNFPFFQFQGGLNWKYFGFDVGVYQMIKPENDVYRPSNFSGGVKVGALKYGYAFLKAADSRDEVPSIGLGSYLGEFGKHSLEVGLNRKEGYWLQIGYQISPHLNVGLRTKYSFEEYTENGEDFVSVSLLYSM
jgi:hypothetical protein